MRASSAVALTLCASFFATLLFAEPRAEPIAQWEIKSGLEGLGGLSGLEVSDDGARFVAVSDDGMLYRGSLLRDEAGDLSGVTIESAVALLIETGTRPDKKRNRDMEGLVEDANGTLHISLENIPRILSYPAPSETPKASSLPEIDASTPTNAGFEAFAFSPNGQFVTLREGSSNARAPFTVFRRDPDGAWHGIYELPRKGGFRPVGADFGPDGHLYILTRAFNGFGFAIQITRIRFDRDTPLHDELLFSGGFRQFDNLEGLAAWRDPAGNTRLTTVSDDNFSRLQSTILVEFRVQE